MDRRNIPPKPHIQLFPLFFPFFPELAARQTARPSSLGPLHQTVQRPRAKYLLRYDSPTTAVKLCLPH